MADLPRCVATHHELLLIFIVEQNLVRISVVKLATFYRHVGIHDAPYGL